MADAERMTPHPILMWPFRMLWKLAGMIVRFTGFLLAILVGLVFMALGVALCFSIAGIVLGIPLFVLGALLVIRGLF